MDTLQLAIAETNNWKTAQIIPSAEEATIEEEIDITSREEPQWTRHKLRCQVDALWIQKDKKTGLGFVLLQDNHKILCGMRNDSFTSSPLQAEARGLI